ncbi:MAG: class I SAM-dependent methyltransferase [Actinomycetota bacterium]|nr:class I SAM-dependent methyltransferase [Actinomycetota bacterium]
MSATHEWTANEWADPDHAGAYLGRGAEWPPHRFEGEAVALALLPAAVGRVLDLGTGDGRLLATVLAAHPGAVGVALDGSPTMLAAAGRRFAHLGADVEVVAHDMDRPLPADRLGCFDAVVSALAIHHCPDPRKQALYREIFALLGPGGVFINLEHVASPSLAVHHAFFRAIGVDPADEDRSNQLAPVETQLGWLRQVGFGDVDCYWKWLELAVLAGRKPPG